MFTAGIEVVTQHPERQVLQQIFAAEELVSGRAEVFEHFLLAFVLFLWGGQAIVAKIEIGGAAAKVEHGVSNALRMRFDTQVRHDTSGIGGRLRSTLFNGESSEHRFADQASRRSEETTSALQSLLRLSSAFFCLTKTNTN